jgi:hypothetical protein
MHDLLRDAFTHVEHEASLFSAGSTPGFTHIYYCRFCHYSSAHVAEHGHGPSCLYDRLKKATDPTPASKDDGPHG